MIFRLLTIFMVPLLVTAENCEQEECLAAAVKTDGPDEATELLQVKGDAVSEESEQKEKNDEEWVAYNPYGPRGGPGHGYVHHNPPGPRGGYGHGTTAVHHNPPGPRGGIGGGTTVYHHHGYR
ncbi:unnamed protein product [Durusdinium trenchii]|uniref:Uncharacterized protein n=1 Tax=Durusdinium trenchii TaxID=1381693 RepID=A0ABP0RN06_9DINO